MSRRTPNQEKAIAWWCQKNDLTPQLSTHPLYYFKDRKGAVTSRNIVNLTGDFERERKANKAKQTQ